MSKHDELMPEHVLNPSDEFLRVFQQARDAIRLHSELAACQERERRLLALCDDALRALTTRYDANIGADLIARLRDVLAERQPAREDT